MNRFRRARNDDRGMTLVELLVTMVLLGVIGTLVTSAMVNAARTVVHVDDENKGLQDAKVILGRELRHTIEKVSPEAAKPAPAPAA